ncbi:MAG: O-antigen ligase family protein [Actinomycetota bacterium]|nr:MAG: bicarbonate transporter IctB [Actinomycetota bacterium]MDO8950825.1 O-antigen ligase family protein [Actinomycetota bacterium]MDP3629919.1 O-antigen ligase family protein [Actinomycetota bacterium]
MAKKKRTGPGSAPQAVAVARAPMTGSERIVWICLHLLVFMVPLAMSNVSVLGANALPLTYDQFDIVKVFLQRAIMLVAVGAWAGGILLKGGRIRFTKIEWLVLAFFGWLVLTSVLSIHPATAVFGKYRRFEGLISFVNYMAVFFMALQVVDRPSRIRSLARTLAISGALVSFYGLLQFFGVDPAKWGALPFELNRAFSTFGNPDLLGGYLIFPLAVSFSLALSEEDLAGRIAYWFVFLITAFCWLIAYVRGAWIGGAVALGILVFALIWAKAKVTAVDWSFSGVIAAIFGIVTVRSLTSPSDVTNVVARITSIFAFKEGSALTRFQIWEAAIAAIRERPIFGWGADTFRLLFPMFKPEAYTATAGYLSVADNVHNYPLQLATALGIPGLVMLYGLFIWGLVVSAKQVFVRGKGVERIVLAGFWAAAVGYLVHLIFGLSVTGSTVFLWLAIGVLLSPGASVREVKAPRWGLYAAAVIVTICAILFVGNIRYVIADNYYLKGRVVDQGQARIDDITKAIEYNPYNDMYRAELGLAWQDLFIQAITQGAAGDAAARQQALMYFTNAEQSMLKTIEFVPTEYDNYVFLANLYNQAAYYFDQSYIDKAIAIAKRGVEVEPFGPAIRVQLAFAYTNLEKYDLAIVEAKRAVELDPNYMEAYSALGDAYRLSGKLQEAKSAYEAALARNSGRSDIKQALTAVEASLAATSGPQ